MQGSARKDVVFGAARVYTATVPGPKWKSWLKPQEFRTLEAELQGWIKYEQGWDHLERREFENAIALLTESVQASPNSAMSYYALAMAHAYQGRTVEALEHVRRALKLKPDDAESQKLKGILERKLGSSGGP